MIVSFIIPMVLLAPAGRAGEMHVEPTDYWTLSFSLPQDAASRAATRARVTLTQPQGYVQMLDAAVRREKGRLRWQVVYPLIDDGRFEAAPGTWNGYWKMGRYHVKAELSAGGTVVRTAEATIDPMSFCPRDHYGPIVVLHRRQFIECSPQRPVYIDTDEMSFTIRTIAQRVERCDAVVDVVSPAASRRLAGPWTMTLTGTAQRRAFSTAGWKRGEYRIRICVLRGGRPVGPYVARKVWKEVLPPEKPPGVREPDGSVQLVAGPWGFSKVRGVRFVSDPLTSRPDGPLVKMEKPWDCELMYPKDLWYDRQRGRYVHEYSLIVRASSPQSRSRLAGVPSRVCTVVSKDGLAWMRPNLGQVEFEGSTANNIGRLPRPKGPKPPPRLKHNYDKAVVRYYDPQRDGPVKMDRLILSNLKGSFLSRIRSVREGRSEFRFTGGAYPVEKRGDLYLVLSRKAILYLGVGMDLYHASEDLRLHIRDRSTGTYYYFFRPAAPAYNPHGSPWDNMHMCRRVLGVLWTRDGVTWSRRFISAPDERDPAGAQYYNMSLPLSRREAAEAGQGLPSAGGVSCVRGGRIYVGSFTFYDARAGRQWPEAVWTTDFIHWNRFIPRRKMIANGPFGSYNYGMIKMGRRYYPLGDQWWYLYKAINQLKQNYTGMARCHSVEALKSRHPQYDRTPGFRRFNSWTRFHEHCRQIRYYPAVARCAAGRLSHAEPTGRRGELVTTLLRGGTAPPVINAVTAPGGSVRVELLDRKGLPIPGFSAEACRAFSGDSVEHVVRWPAADPSRRSGRIVQLRFILDRAKLYAYRF